MKNTIHAFNYIKLGSFYRPIIPVALRNGDAIIDFPALVDSGADFNLFPKFLADMLRIDINNVKSERIAGLGGSVPGYPSALEIGIEDDFYSAPLVFSDDTTVPNFGILGQMGFFNRFVVTFDYSGKQITVTKKGIT